MEYIYNKSIGHVWAIGGEGGGQGIVQWTFVSKYESIVTPVKWEFHSKYLSDITCQTEVYLTVKITEPLFSMHGESDDLVIHRVSNASVYIALRLTHWDRVTHIWVSKLTIIGSDNGLSPARRQAIIWTDAGTLLIGPVGTTFSEILIEICICSFKKMHLKISSGDWRPFCFGLNMLKNISPNNELSIEIQFLTVHVVAHNNLWVVRVQFQ